LINKCYPDTYCLIQGSCVISSNFEKLTSKLESQPLKVFTKKP